MAESIVRSNIHDVNENHKKPHHSRNVCFSFAAYSKSVIHHLRSRGVSITIGLSDPEFSAIESTHNFMFPPDLRSLLREGLPVGSGFPNWRSASTNHIRILLSRPISTLIREISRPESSFWPPGWGSRPESREQSIATARFLLSGAAKLVPVYQRFYIAANPNLAGNPLFHVQGRNVRCCGFDLADFFSRGGWSFFPAWAAKEARRVEIWSELADGDEGGSGMEELVREMGWKLRGGGWGEKEVREMMCGSDRWVEDRTVVKDRDGLVFYLRGLAKVMLRAGWSTEDVVYAVGGDL